MSQADLALASNAWPFQEAQRLVERFGKATPAKGYVLFETGYGPSGLPHIGTFGEVARTSMVRRALKELWDVPSRLFAFSDDMDGLRKVPDNVPNQDMLRAHLGKPLTEVPDPFGKFESFGHHNNAMLRDFLDRFGFEYEFQSSTEWYKSGRFDQTLLQILRHYDAIQAIMLPTLGPERRATYSPFLPVSRRNGQVLQVPVVERNVDAGTIIYRDEDGTLVETPVTGGHCKMQWKVDWAMRWVALGVDYEMSGKDLIDSVKLSSRIAKELGAEPPINLTYELFLDEKGEKISKSKGNGLTIENWLTYGSPESLALYMYQKPRQAKRLHFDVIPRAVDEYFQFLEGYHEANDLQKRYANPVWHIHAGNPPAGSLPLTFNILLNLASVINAQTPEMLWGFVSAYRPGASPATEPALDRLIGYALAYYRDVVKPTKKYRPATDIEKAAFAELNEALAPLVGVRDSETLQNEVYEVGKRHPFPSLRDWFRSMYEVLLGSEQGPRMGSFIALYGVAETRALLGRALAGEDLSL